MSGQPRIGAESETWTEGLCGFAPVERDIECFAEATWHGITADRKGAECCDAHLAVVQAIAQWVHPLEPACASGEAHFLEEENRCIVPWANDPRTEAAALAHASGGQP